jgi:hypothetical protein
MDRRQIADWLLAHAGHAANHLQDAIADEEARVEKLRAELAAPLPFVTEDTVDTLRAKAAELDGEIASLRSELRTRCGQLRTEIAALLERARAAVASDIIADTQELFDTYAPGYLRQPIATASLFMLARDLENAPLRVELRAYASTAISSCVSMMRDESVAAELTRAEEMQAAVLVEIAEATSRCRDHDVTVEVLDGLRTLRDPQRFMDGVVLVYTRAADLERTWSMPAFELGRPDGAR